MIACVRDNIIIEFPQVAPDTWTDPNPIDPNKSTYSGFNNLSLEEMFDLGWKEVVDSPLSFNELFERRTIGAWRYDSVNDCVTRDYSIELLTFEEALTNSYILLSNNQFAFETGGIPYTLNGFPLIIYSDREDAQVKIAGTYIAIVNDLRQDNDIWRFKQLNGNQIAFPVSNYDMKAVCEYFVRVLFDAALLQCNIAWSMLGCGTTEILKLNVENGTINLNPWDV